MNFGYRSSFQIADKGLIEVIGPFGIALNMLNTTKFISIFHSGYVFHYTLVMMFSITFVFSYLLSFTSFGSINALTFLAIVVFYLHSTLHIN
jgi:hypothetical protein